MSAAGVAGSKRQSGGMWPGRASDARSAPRQVRERTRPAARPIAATNWATIECEMRRPRRSRQQERQAGKQAVVNDQPGRTPLSVTSENQEVFGEFSRHPRSDQDCKDAQSTPGGFFAGVEGRLVLTRRFDPLRSACVHFGATRNPHHSMPTTADEAGRTNGCGKVFWRRSDCPERAQAHPALGAAQGKTEFRSISAAAREPEAEQAPERAALPGAGWPRRWEPVRPPAAVELPGNHRCGSASRRPGPCRPGSGRRRFRPGPASSTSCCWTRACSNWVTRVKSIGPGLVLGQHNGDRLFGVVHAGRLVAACAAGRAGMSPARSPLPGWRSAPSAGRWRPIPGTWRPAAGRC